MLEHDGVARQHEHAQSREPRPVRRRRGCACGLHADADRWLYVPRSAVSRSTWRPLADDLRRAYNEPADGPAGLAAGRDRVSTLLGGLIVASERKIELPPYRNQRISQLSDQPSVMRRGGGNPQSLGAAGDCGIVDRLDVDPMLFEQKIARLLAQIGIADHDRHDMRLRRQHRQAGFPQSRLGRRHRGALARTLRARYLEMGDRGCRSRGHRGWQRRREDKSGSMAADGAHEGAATTDIASKRTESLGKRSFDDVDARHYPVPLGDAGTARPVHTDGMYLVEIGHRAIALSKVADRSDWRDVAVHRIEALEDDQLGPVGRRAREQRLQVLKIIVAPDLLSAAGGTHAFDHRIVVERV